MLFPTLDPKTLEQIYLAAQESPVHQVAVTFLDPDRDEDGAEACRRMTLHASIEEAAWDHDRSLFHHGVEVTTNLSDLRVQVGDEPRELHLLEAASTASFLEEVRDALAGEHLALVQLDGGFAVFASDGVLAERLLCWLREQGASARPAA